METKLISQRQLYALFAAIAVGAGVIAWLVFEPAGTKADLAATEKMEQVATLPLPSPADIAATFGGLSPNAEQQGLVTRVGEHLATSGDVVKLGRTFRFYLLADQARLTSFAMPDGSIFITTLMLNYLKTEGQLAAILATQMAHVTARHTPVYLVTGKLRYKPEETTAAAMYAVHYMSQAGYDPRSLGDLLTLLGSTNAKTPLEYYDTHPAEADTSKRVEAAITQEFPNGVPDNLSK
jgi:beta-barrel assembly-enhancing protease